MSLQHRFLSFLIYLLLDLLGFSLSSLLFVRRNVSLLSCHEINETAGSAGGENGMRSLFLRLFWSA
jgi:hypothetical protein